MALTWCPSSASHAHSHPKCKPNPGPHQARRHFTACHELGGRVEALISAVNMTLKLEEYERAAEQYGAREWWEVGKEDLVIG